MTVELDIRHIAKYNAVEKRSSYAFAQKVTFGTAIQEFFL